MNQASLVTARSKRIRQVRFGIAKDRLHAFLFTDLANVFYLTGFTGSDGAFLLTPKEAILLVDGRYGAQAKLQSPYCRSIVYETKAKGIVQEIDRRKIRRIGYEPNALTVAFHRSLRKELSKVSWITPSGWHLSLRAIKDKWEIQHLLAANRAVDTAFRSITRKIRPGVAEIDIAFGLEVGMRKRGADGVSFPISVAGGLNSSFPHARSGRRPVRSGEPIFIDFGGTFGGYQTDQTVTLFLGKVPKLWEEVYSIVKRAHDLAIASARPGMTGADLDGIAREEIARRGFGEYFSHSLGHGVGIQVHEYPSISSKSKARLEPGMVFTIEPGIYLPGKGGVRIEDTVYMTPRGVEVMTSIDKILRAR